MPRKEIINLIKKLKKKYKVGIFSDQTNWIYEIDKNYNFLHIFDYKFISYDVGYTKEDDEIFEIVIDKCDVSPEKILFVDDREKILDNAKRFNFQSYKFESVDNTVKDLFELLNC